MDNAYWGGDLGIPTPRSSYQVNQTKFVKFLLPQILCSKETTFSSGTDVVAQASAAFSACSALYANHALSSFSGPASLTDISYATTLLGHAQQLYAFATNTTQQTYQKSVPASADAYPSSGYTDDLTLAAMFLSLASNSSTLYQQAMTNYKNYNLDQYVRAGNEQPFDWDSKTPGLVVLGAQIASTYPSIGNVSDNSVNFTREAEDYLDSMLNGHGRTFTTHGAYSYCCIIVFSLQRLVSFQVDSSGIPEIPIQFH